MSIEEDLRDLDLESVTLSYGVLEKYELGVSSSFRRHMNPREDYSGLRLSQIGKPAVLQAMWALGFKYDEGIALKMRLTFHLGDLFEHLLIVLLQAAGYEILDHNNDTIRHGIDGNGGYIEYGGVRGHSDLVVKAPDGTVTLIEAKTMNDRYFTTFTKEPDDERGYISQLTLYEEALGMQGAWVCFNKNTSEIAVKTLTSEHREWAKGRADRIIPVLKTIEESGDFETLRSMVEDGVLQAPPPVNEVFKRKDTGALLVPQSMKYTEYKHCFYNILVDKNGYNKDTEYVIEVYEQPKHPEELGI